MKPILRTPELERESRLLSSRKVASDGPAQTEVEPPSPVDRPDSPGETVQQHESGPQVSTRYDDQPGVDMPDPPQENPLSGALAEAEARVRDLERELGSLRDERDATQAEARAEGLEQGRREGLEQVAKSLEEKTLELDRLLQSLARERTTLSEQQEDFAVEIVFAAVIRILGDALATRDGAAACVKQVMGQLRHRDKLIVRVSPEDYAVLNEHREGLVSDRESGLLELAPDDQVKLGGCILENESGSLDGRLELQLQILRDTLLKVRARSGSRA